MQDRLGVGRERGLDLSRADSGFDAFGETVARKKLPPANFSRFEMGLFGAAHNRDAPGAIADFDATQFFTRFHIDDGDVV